MTEQQKLEVIAKACGWKENYGCAWWEHPNSTVPRITENFRFLTDANTRQEMLAVMSDSQRMKLDRRLKFAYQNFASPGIPFSVYLLTMKQPLFADCWLKAMGLWLE